MASEERSIHLSHFQPFELERWQSEWEHKVDIVWDGPPAETDIAGEMKIVETMINRQVDAIVLAPSDRSARHG